MTFFWGVIVAALLFYPWGVLILDAPIDPIASMFSALAYFGVLFEWGKRKWS